MANQIENLLRTLVNGDKDAAITQFVVSDDPSLFTSRLTKGYPRKAIWVYNNSSNDIVCYYGYSSDITAEFSVRPIPCGTAIKIPVTTNIPIYFSCEDGETGDLRIEEVA